jgi:hypothetical protein
MRLSEKRALGIVIAACKTRLIWFDLEGDFEETQADEAEGDVEDEECFTDAVGMSYITSSIGSRDLRA